MVARRAHNPKVVGSSPAPATKKKINPVIYKLQGFSILMRTQMRTFLLFFSSINHFFSNITHSNNTYMKTLKLYKYCYTVGRKSK